MESSDVQIRGDSSKCGMKEYFRYVRIFLGKNTLEVFVKFWRWRHKVENWLCHTELGAPWKKTRPRTDSIKLLYLVNRLFDEKKEKSRSCLVVHSFFYYCWMLRLIFWSISRSLCLRKGCSIKDIKASPRAGQGWVSNEKWTRPCGKKLYSTITLHYIFLALPFLSLTLTPSLPHSLSLSLSFSLVLYSYVFLSLSLPLSFSLVLYSYVFLSLSLCLSIYLSL